MLAAFLVAAAQISVSASSTHPFRIFIYNQTGRNAKVIAVGGPGYETVYFRNIRNGNYVQLNRSSLIRTISVRMTCYDGSTINYGTIKVNGSKIYLH